MKARLWALLGRVTTARVYRLPFVLAGVVLVIVKCFCDTIMAVNILGNTWSVAYYLSPVQAYMFLDAHPQEESFFGFMMAVAAPFVVAGVLLTLARLRAVAWPPWLVCLFFVPFVNLLFFTILSLAPSRDAVDLSAGGGVRGPRSGFPRLLPDGFRLSSGAVLTITSLLGVALTCFNVYALGVYGFGLFVGLPFGLGLIAAILYGYGQERSRGGCVGVAFASVGLTAVALVGIKLEGAICIAMAAPIWSACALLGGLVGFQIQQCARDERDVTLLIVGLVLAVPVLMGAEAVALPAAPIFAVQTDIEIAAPSPEVWKRVVSFPAIPPPDEWLFKTGVAFPTAATIDGEVVGATRRCEFTTGTFVEPIEVWDEPRLLRFSVTQSPPPMEEWTLYGSAHPPHLRGFMVSRGGEFRLESVSDSTTRLVGTTWYQHHMWPARYWRLWSDFMIHRIHTRVLEHIRRLSEASFRRG